MILTLLNLFLSLGPALMPVLVLGYIAVRHQRLFLTLFMLLTALEATRDFAPKIEMTLSGFTVYPEDLTIVVGTVAAILGIGRWHLRWVTRTASIVFAGLVGLGLITWISTFGLQVGVNSWRPQILIVVLLMYTTTRPRAWSWNDIKVIVVAPAIVVAIASALGILLYGFGSSSSFVEIGGVQEGVRPILAPGALLMLVGLWVTVLSAGEWYASRVLVVLLLGSMVLLTQHRSVWVAAIFGVVVWWVVPRISVRGTADNLGGAGRTTSVFFVGTAMALVGATVAQLEESASSDVTLLWRITRWTDSMSVPRSWFEWLVGSAFGPTPATVPELFETSAHSLYVNAIELTGFVGLMAILCLVFSVGRAHVPMSVDPFGLIVCFTFLGFGLTYQLLPWGWMLAGILLTWTGSEQPGGSVDDAESRAGASPRSLKMYSGIAAKSR